MRGAADFNVDDRILVTVFPLDGLGALSAGAGEEPEIRRLVLENDKPVIVRVDFFFHDGCSAVYGSKNLKRKAPIIMRPSPWASVRNRYLRIFCYLRGGGFRNLLFAARGGCGVGAALRPFFGGPGRCRPPLFSLFRSCRPLLFSLFRPCAKFSRLLRRSDGLPRLY